MSYTMQADASHGGSASSVAAGLGHIYRGAQQTGTDAAALKAALSKHTDLLPAAVESITSVYSSVHGSTASTAVALAPPTRPQLVGVEWAVGANLASSSVAATAPPAPLPFVSMQLRIRHPDGSFGRESVEMSVPQLRLFESALKEAVAALDKA